MATHTQGGDQGKAELEAWLAGDQAGQEHTHRPNQPASKEQEALAEKIVESWKGEREDLDTQEAAKPTHENKQYHAVFKDDHKSLLSSAKGQPDHLKGASAPQADDIRGNNQVSLKMEGRTIGNPVAVDMEAVKPKESLWQKFKGFVAEKLEQHEDKKAQEAAHKDAGPKEQPAGSEPHPTGKAGEAPDPGKAKAELEDFLAGKPAKDAAPGQDHREEARVVEYDPKAKGGEGQFHDERTPEDNQRTMHIEGLNRWPMPQRDQFEQLHAAGYDRLEVETSKGTVVVDVQQEIAEREAFEKYGRAPGNAEARQDMEEARMHELKDELADKPTPENHAEHAREAFDKDLNDHERQNITVNGEKLHDERSHEGEQSKDHSHEKGRDEGPSK